MTSITDATLILDGSRESLMACLQILDDFYAVSALRLNDKNTEALRRTLSGQNTKLKLLEFGS